MMELGVHIERQHHEVATAGQAEIDYRFEHAAAGGRHDDGLQVRRQERGAPARQDGDVHAQTALWRQRQRDAHPPEPVEEGQAAVCRQRIRGAEPDGALLRGRVAQARAGVVRVVQSDDQQLQAAGAGLRSAGEPGLQLRATAARRSAFRPTARARKPSASSIARRIRRPIRIWPLRRC